MDHKLLEAKATATDQGAFTAIAAAYSVDRVKDRIVPGAFGDSIKRWQESGKNIPLHWDHEGDATSIIGYVDPATVSEVEDGLQVSGQLDLKNSETAREAWRVIKQNSVGLSFGYMVEDSKAAEDGITDLKTIDLFEISIVAAPANPDTRFISLKSLSPDLRETIEGFGKRLDELEGRIVAIHESGALKTSEVKEETETEDRKGEEPSRPTPIRQDSLVKDIEDLWLATAAGPDQGESNAVSKRTPAPTDAG